MMSQGPPPPPRHYPDRVDEAPKPRRRAPLIAAAFGVLAVVGAALGVSVQTQERPAYLATAIMAPEGCDWQIEDCVARDVNVQVWPDGRAEIAEPEFDRDGHAALPEWRAELGPLPDGAIPFAPSLGWGTDAIPLAVGAKERPLYYCAEERRQWDATHPGYDTAAGGYWSLREVIDYFDLLAPQEDCSHADLVMGANAEADCGGPGAWGCAALRFQGSRPYIRVTFNGTALAAGTMPISAVQAIDWHEDYHMLGLAHTGGYGGEPGPHPHRSNLGYMCVTGGRAYPCDNPTGEPGTEDLHAAPLFDGTYRYGWRLKPSDPPPPPPCEAEVIFQEWDHVEGDQFTSRELARQTVPVGDGRWFVVIANLPDGRQAWSSFVGVSPCEVEQ